MNSDRRSIGLPFSGGGVCGSVKQKSAEQRSSMPAPSQKMLKLADQPSDADQQSGGDPADRSPDANLRKRVLTVECG